MIDILLIAFGVGLVLFSSSALIGLTDTKNGRYDVYHRNTGYDWTPMYWSLPWKWTARYLFIPFVMWKHGDEGLELKVDEK